MWSIFHTSLVSVLRLCIVCAAGTLLARKGLMPGEFRRLLSRVIVVLMLPCLLVSKLSVSASWENLRQWSFLPVVALVYVLAGLLLGRLVVWCRSPPPELRRAVNIACAFGNSGHVPYPLVIAIAATASLFQGDPTAADRGIAYVSVYLVVFSPCLWGLGYPLLANEPFRRLRLGQVLSPPVLSVLTGIALGVLPPCRWLLVGPDAPLRLLMGSAEMIGQGAIPCALLILGANLADSDPRGATLDTGTSLGVAAVRLLLMPLVGLGVVLWLRDHGLIPDDPMCALVLMLEGATPPATNLIVMCQVHNQGERAMSKILLVNYLAAVPALTLFVTLFLWVVGRAPG